MDDGSWQCSVSHLFHPIDTDLLIAVKVTHMAVPMVPSTSPRRSQIRAGTFPARCEYTITLTSLGAEHPRNLTMLIGFLTAFPMSLALMFGMTDIDSVLNSKLPSAEIFYQITGSRIIVTFMMCWVILVYFSKSPA